jgi:hypothetical protein
VYGTPLLDDRLLETDQIGGPGFPSLRTAAGSATWALSAYDSNQGNADLERVLLPKK